MFFHGFVIQFLQTIFEVFTAFDLIENTTQKIFTKMD